MHPIVDLNRVLHARSGGGRGCADFSSNFFSCKFMESTPKTKSRKVLSLLVNSVPSTSSVFLL